MGLDGGALYHKSDVSVLLLLKQQTESLSREVFMIDAKVKCDYKVVAKELQMYTLAGI